MCSYILVTILVIEDFINSGEYYGDVGFSFSYDVNFTELNISLKGRVAVELVIIYSSGIFDNQKRTKIMYPKF